MADALDALSSSHAKDPVITDSYLFTLARFGDPEAVTQLWNRYYTIAALAAMNHATKKEPAAVLVTSSFDRWLERTVKRTNSDSFMANWFEQIPAEAPTPLHRAVLWAFYAMSVQNRTIVWRHNVDQWTTDQITEALELDPQKASVVAQAEDQFASYLAMAAAALGLPANLPDFAPGNWRSLLISAMLGSSTEVYDELGSRIDSSDVITPPDSPQPFLTQASAKIPISSVVRVASIVVVAVALALIGVLGLTRWSRTVADQPEEILTPTATVSRTPTPSPTPSQTPTQTPSPTPEETPEESTEPESEPQSEPQNNPQPTRTTAAPVNPAPQPQEPPPTTESPGWWETDEPTAAESTTESTEGGNPDEGNEGEGTNQYSESASAASSEDADQLARQSTG